MECLNRERSVIEVADVSKPEQVERLISDTAARYGAIDVLVNSAEVTWVSGFLKHSNSDWHELLSTNLIGVIYLIRAALPHLLKAKGAIVNVSSMTGLGSEAGNSFYAIADAGINNLTQSLASEFGGAGVRINGVTPGLMTTGATAPLLDPNLAYLHIGDQALDRVARGRIARPDEIASTVAFLASTDASFFNGVNLPVIVAPTRRTTIVAE
jgi:meso-butanediol dehydrogenase/(S,S)-butanediol dehydrogenase/diacetyl reductase